MLYKVLKIWNTLLPQGMLVSPADGEGLGFFSFFCGRTVFSNVRLRFSGINSVIVSVGIL